MKKFVLGFTALIFILGGIYLAGPKFPKPVLNNQLPEIKLQTGEVENFIRNKEKSLKIKPDNESRIIWADSLRSKTPFSLLYIHGFAASWYEGSPANTDFAGKYGMNLYAPLLAEHGIESAEPLLEMTPGRLYESAKEALVIAHKLGEKVILMSTSTGGTLSLKLAADFPELVDGLILYSPNVAINDPAAFLLSKPWGLQIARLVKKGNYRISETKHTEEEQYWICKQRLESAVYLQQLIEATMTQNVFKKVKQPTFLAYYYQDETNKDDVVRVDAMLKMFDQLGTPENLKQKQAFPEAKTHVIACKLLSGAWQEVETASFRFAEEKLGLKPVQQ
jgi:esterase/lipase